MKAEEPTLVRLDGFAVDLRHGALLDGSGTVIPLRVQSLAVLRFLALHPDRVVSKDELFDAIWPRTAVTEDSLVQCIGDIRRALGDKGSVIVRTAPRRGYVLNTMPAAPAEPAETAAVAQPAVGLPVSTPAPRRLHIGLLAAMLAAIILILPAAIFLHPSDASGWRPSIAVVPFRNVVGDARGGQLAYGFTEDLITDLARYGDILVIAWDTVAPYENRETAPQEVSRDLGVRYVLDGSIRSDGARSRVSAQLVDGESGTVLWAGRYDRPSIEIFEVQDELTAMIVNELAGMTGAVLKAERRQAAADRPRSIEAFGLYADAIRIIDDFTPEGLRDAEARLTAALAIDPTLARAWYKLAMVHFTRAAYGFADDMDTEFSRYSEAIQRAANLDPEDALIQAAVASDYIRMGRPDMGREAYRRALLLGPNDADTLATIAYTRPTKFATASEDLELVRRAVRLNPIVPEWYGLAHGYAAYHAGEYEEALHALADIKPGITDAHLYRALSLAELGRTNEAAKERDLLLSILPNLTTASLIEGDLMQVPEAIEHFRESARKAGLPP